VVLAAGGAVVAQQPWQHHSISATEAVLDAPDARSTSVDFPRGASATVTHSDELGRAVIVVHHMPAPPKGRVYQLWLDQPGKGMVSAGLMPAGSSDTTLLLQGDATTATAAGITVEPAGGSSAPTSAPIALFDFGSKA
jgi:anti-sigma-K factor RskA